MPWNSTSPTKSGLHNPERSTMKDLYTVLLCLSLLSVGLGMIVLHIFTAQQLDEHYRRLRKLMKKHKRRKHKDSETA